MSMQIPDPNDDPKQKRPACRRMGRPILWAAAAVIILGLVFWLLWNWAAAPLFTFPPLTYLQALVATMIILLLAGMLRCIAGRNRRISSPDATSDVGGPWRCSPDRAGKRDI